MTIATATKPTTTTIEVWAIVTREMAECGFDQPDVSFDEPWQMDQPGNECRKLTAEVPDDFELRYDQTNGHLLLWNKHQDDFFVFPQIDHDMQTLTLATLDEDGWNDGTHNVVKCPLTPAAR